MNNQEPDPLQELQSLWDWQDDRMADLSARPEKGLNMGSLHEDKPVVVFFREHRQQLWRYAAAVAALLLVAGVWLYSSNSRSHDASSHVLVANNESQLTTPQSETAPQEATSEAVQPADPTLVAAVLPSLTARGSDTPASVVKDDIVVSDRDSEPPMEPVITPTAKPEVSETSETTKQVVTPETPQSGQPRVEARERGTHIKYNNLRDAQAINDKDKHQSHKFSSSISDGHGYDSRYQLEARVGLSGTILGSSLSILDDAAEATRLPDFALAFGWRQDNALFGLECSFGFASAEAQGCNDQLMRSDVAWLMRHYKSLGSSVSYYRGLALGVTLMHNSLTYLDEKQGYNRFGFLAEVELGLQLDLSEHTYLGLRASAGLTPLFNNRITLPDPLHTNTKNLFSAYTLSLTFGTKF